METEKGRSRNFQLLNESGDVQLGAHSFYTDPKVLLTPKFCEIEIGRIRTDPVRILP
jgi:hypothetical protein